ncbi:MAG: EAL domain-containing protein [Gammaproteobacteria bacterium]
MPSNIENQHSSVILVVDDDITIRFMVKEALEQQGFIVEEAENGKQAIERAQELLPDIILLDVMMPVMDGFSSCIAIRKIPECEHTPILMMTGLEDIESIDKAYEAGATDFATKPINYTLLSHRIFYMLRSKQTADDLRSSQEKLGHAQRLAKLGYWEWDFNQHVSWSDQITDTFWLEPDKSSGDITYFFKNLYKKDMGKVKAVLKFARDKQQNFKLEYRIKNSDGKIRIVYHEAEITYLDSGKPHRLIGTIQDITDRKHAESKIEKLSNYDKVTGLANRTLLRQKLDNIISRNNSDEHIAAILTLDLDRFKRINDTLGHQSGDDLLRNVAKRLSQSIEEYIEDDITSTRMFQAKPALDITLAHFGGDEFVVLMDGIHAVEEAAIMSRIINNSIAEPVEINSNVVSITASIGISAYPEDGSDVESLLMQSGAALNHAKNEGRNCYKFFTTSMNSRAYERLTLEVNLHKAIEEEQFVLFYQPKVDTKSGKLRGMEALIRWQHPDLGMISPADFIPVAEQTGMIIQIGQWVLEETCRFIKRMQDEGLPETIIAINLSGVQFSQANLPEILSKTIKNYGINSELIELEITESLIMNDVEQAINTLKKLRDLGFSIAIDDFGTGYSSLSYLKKFPITTLKVDQSFVQGIEKDEDDRAIVQAVISLAHSLRLKVVAEGIEEAGQLEILKEQGCDIIQGYYFSRPLAGEDMIDWATQHDEELKDELEAALIV